MRIAIQKPAGKTLLLAAVLLGAAAYVASGAVQFLAAHFAQSTALNDLRRAVWLQPGNASYHHLLGRYFALVQPDPEAAEASYRSAIALNPHSARYWLDLAALYQQTGKESAERDALQQALRLDPNTPDVAWEVGSLYLVLGDADQALKQFKIALANDPYIAPLALQFCWRLRPDVDLLLRDVLPALPSVYSSFLNLLISKEETAGTTKVWDRLVQLRQPVENHYIFGYIRFLVDRRETDQASLVWRQAPAVADLSAYQPTPDNLIVNGDFSRPVLNGGFDWLYDRKRGVDLALDTTTFYSGNRSLRLTLDAPGLADAGIRHLISVKPGTNYEFSGYFKADDMQGVGGLRLVVQDQLSGATHFSSDDLGNTHVWTKVGGSFTTGPDAKLLVLRVMRNPVGSSIRGQLWIDALKLAPKG